MDRLYRLAQPFAGHPLRVFLVATGLLVVAWSSPRAGRRPFLLAAACWAIFGLLEAEALRERADIRVDLLFTWPALCVVTLACVITGVHRIARTRGRPRDGT